MNFADMVEQWKNCVSRGDMEGYAAHYAPDARLIVPLSADAIAGREAIRAYESTLAKAMPGATLRLLWRAGEGDAYAAEWEWSGKNTGPLATPQGVLPPTHRHVCLRGVSFFRFRADGLVAEEHRLYDSRSLFQQLGLETTPGEKVASAGR